MSQCPWMHLLQKLVKQGSEEEQDEARNEGIPDVYATAEEHVDQYYSPIDNDYQEEVPAPHRSQR